MAFSLAGSDYIVEAQIGRVRILNSSVLNSGREIVIEYERPDMFQNQIRTLLGTRLDYMVNRDLSIGFTAMKYKERTAGFLSGIDRWRTCEQHNAGLRCESAKGCSVRTQ